MKHGAQLRRALFLATALAFAGQARALGAASGQGSSATGGPQGVYDLHRSSDDAPSMSEQGSTGVPTWYAVDVTPRTPPAPAPAMVVVRGGSIPRWYAID